MNIKKQPPRKITCSLFLLAIGNALNICMSEAGLLRSLHGKDYFW